MDPQEFCNEMRRIKNEYRSDWEKRHFLMDELMCKVLKELGYEEGVILYEITAKWYS